MSEIMSHQQWMSLTHGGRTSVRSSKLKNVDKLLEKYHRSKSDADKEALTGALLAWIQSKGAGWKTSVRNQKQAVEILHNQLMGVGGTKLTGPEMVGLSHVRDESRAIVDDLFRGKRLEWRSSFKAKLGQQKFGTTLNTVGVVRNSDTLSGGKIKGSPKAVKTAIRGPSEDSMAQDLYQSVVPPDLMSDVTVALAEIMPNFMKELAASLTPWVGVITSGGAAVWNGKNSLRGKWRAEWTRYHIAQGLATAEPEMALSSLSRCLHRELHADVFSMSVSLAEFGGKLAGVLADTGTATNAAVGLAANVTKLLNIVRIIVRDVLERNAANRQMMLRVDATIFDTCPVVGCYLICCVPTSVLVNSIFEDRFGEPGWQSQVEGAVKRHLPSLKEQARRVVKEHRFWIPSLADQPGLMAVNTKKLKEMLERKGKTGMVGFGSEDLVSASG